jgi:hypothetical protein
LDTGFIGGDDSGMGRKASLSTHSGEWVTL